MNDNNGPQIASPVTLIVGKLVIHNAIPNIFIVLRNLIKIYEWRGDFVSNKKSTAA